MGVGDDRDGARFRLNIPEEAEVAGEGIRVLGPEVGLDAAQGEFHRRSVAHAAIRLDGSNKQGRLGLGPK